MALNLSKYVVEETRDEGRDCSSIFFSLARTGTWELYMIYDHIGAQGRNCIVLPL